MENKQFEENSLIFVNQMEALISRKMFPEALSLAEERLAKFPSDLDARVFINSTLIEMGRIEESRNVLNGLEKDIIKLSFGYLRAADNYYNKGIIQDAIFCYQKFIALNPHSENSLEVTEKIALLQQEGNTACEEGIEEDKDDAAKPEFYTMTLADLYIKQGHLKMAADILEEIIKREPSNVQAREKMDTINVVLAQKPLSPDAVDSTNKVINILSCWLDNIGRLKTHAT
ncbi:MAG: tetratricopeptide repeat protein [Smithella sp.]